MDSSVCIIWFDGCIYKVVKFDVDISHWVSSSFKSVIQGKCLEIY